MMINILQDQAHIGLKGYSDISLMHGLTPRNTQKMKFSDC